MACEYGAARIRTNGGKVKKTHMSIDFRLAKNISIFELLGPRIQRRGLTTLLRDKGGKKCEGFIWDDKGNRLWINPVLKTGGPIFMTTSVWGSPFGILHAIRKEFNTRIHLESEPQFWGYRSRREWYNANPDSYGQLCGKPIPRDTRRRRTGRRPSLHRRSRRRPSSRRRSNRRSSLRRRRLQR